MKIWLTLFLSTFSLLGSAASEQTMLLETEKNNISVYQNSHKSIVGVSNIKIARSFWDLDYFEVPQGAGSGFIWDNQGHIVTNYHVVEGSDSIVITLAGDKENYNAEVIGVAPEKDIAVLKVKEFAKKATPVQPGVSKNLMVGQKVLAIGNPFGLDHTMTVGVISALERKIKGIGGVSIQGMIQTDASINPGNSGGPLFNSSGQVIGMNTMIYSNSGSSAGIGFAVPIDTIKRYVDQIIKYGKIIRPGLGVTTLNRYQRERFGISRGVVIRSVLNGSGAEKVGLEGISRDRYGRYALGDIILSVNKTNVDSLDDLFQILDTKKVGDKVEVEILRGRKKKRFQVELSNVTKK